MPIEYRYSKVEKTSRWEWRTLYEKKTVWVCPRCKKDKSKLGGYETDSYTETIAHLADHLLE